MNDRELDFAALSGAPPQNNTSRDTQRNVAESGEGHVARDDLDSRSAADEILQATPDSRRKDRFCVPFSFGPKLLKPYPL